MSDKNSWDTAAVQHQQREPKIISANSSLLIDKEEPDTKNCVDLKFDVSSDYSDSSDDSSSSINTTRLDLNNNSTCKLGFAKHTAPPRHYSTRNTPSLLFTSFFHASHRASVLSELVMSYEEQLQKAVEKGNLELCNELLLKSCNVNVPVNKLYPLCIDCEQNY